MARVTVEDCLERVSNRFALTVLAARRARALSEGRGTPLVDCENKEEVTALREISAGHVRWIEDVDGVMRQFIEEQRLQLRSTTGEHTFLEAASLTGGDGEEEEDEDVVEELPSDLEKLGTGSADDEEDEEEEGGPEDVVDEDGDVAADDSLPTDEDFDEDLSDESLTDDDDSADEEDDDGDADD